MAPRKAQEDSKMVKEASGGADHIVKYEVICTSLEDGPALLSYTCVQKCQFSLHFCTCARTRARTRPQAQDGCFEKNDFGKSFCLRIHGDGLTHLLICLLTHLLTCLLTHLLTCLRTYLLIYLLTYLLIYSLTHIMIGRVEQQPFQCGMDELEPMHAYVYMYVYMDM